MTDRSNDQGNDPIGEIRGLAEAQLRGELDDEAALRLELESNVRN